MQKLLFATAIAVSTSFAPLAAFAADDSNDGAFAHVGIGRSTVFTGPGEFDRKKATSFDLTGGYHWGLGRSFALGAEGGYAYLGSVRKTYIHGSPAKAVTKHRMRTGAWLVGVNAKWNMTDHLSLIGRAGEARVRGRDSSRTNGSRNMGTVDSSRWMPYFGLGVGYALTSQLDLTLQATRYGKKTGSNDWSATTYNAGVGYHF